jgi:hypothetical protein
MGKSGSELLVYGLIIAGFLLFNFLAQKLARKAREQQEAVERAEAQAQPAEAEDTLEDPWGRPLAAPVPAPQPAVRRAPATLAPPARHARSPHALFRTPQDLRRAIVVMTVLGPCRALEPFDRR